MGKISSGGLGRSKYPKGAYVVVANFSSCRRVGFFFPPSQSFRFLLLLLTSSGVLPERLMAHSSSSLFTSIRRAAGPSFCFSTASLNWTLPPKWLHGYRLGRCTQWRCTVYPYRATLKEQPDSSYFRIVLLQYLSLERVCLFRSAWFLLSRSGYSELLCARMRSEFEYTRFRNSPRRSSGPAHDLIIVTVSTMRNSPGLSSLPHLHPRPSRTQMLPLDGAGGWSEKPGSLRQEPHHWPLGRSEGACRGPDAPGQFCTTSHDGELSGAVLNRSSWDLVGRTCSRMRWSSARSMA